MKVFGKIVKMVTGLALGASAIASFGATGPERRPLKVLMVGNSFSICVLNEMPAIAASYGRPLDLASLYIGGCPLSRHTANLSATNHPYDVRWNYCGRKDLAAVPFAGRLVAKTWPQGHTDQQGNLRDVLAGDRWDVVTIQQKASRPRGVPPPSRRGRAGSAVNNRTGRS